MDAAHRTRHINRLFAAVALAVTVSACGAREAGDASKASERNRAGEAAPVQPTDTAASADVETWPQTPQRTPAAAVAALLDAERAGNHRVSYAYISSEGRARYTDPDAWARHRRGRPPVVGFETERSTGSAVVVLVEHTPGIDAFRGLQLAQERQTWQTREELGGWTVDAEPEVQAIVPSDESAPPVAERWANARRECDDVSAAALQAVSPPFGISVAAHTLCKSQGPLSVGAPQPVAPGPRTTQLVEQYGPEVVRHLRSVDVTGGPAAFAVLLVPIGDDWRVIGASDL